MKKIICTFALISGFCFGSEEPNSQTQPSQKNDIPALIKGQTAHNFISRYKPFFLGAGLVSFGNWFKSRPKFSVPFTFLCAGFVLKQEKVLNFGNALYSITTNLIDETIYQTDCLTKRLDDRVTRRQLKPNNSTGSKKNNN